VDTPSKHEFQETSGFGIRQNELWAISAKNTTIPHLEGIYHWRVGLFDIPDIPEPKAPNCKDCTVQMIRKGKDGWGFETLHYPEKQTIGMTLLQMEKDGVYDRNTWAWFSVWPNEEDLEVGIVMHQPNQNNLTN